MLVIFNRLISVCILFGLLTGIMQIVISTNNAFLTVYWLLLAFQVLMYVQQRFIDNNTFDLKNEFLRDFSNELLKPLLFPVRKIPVYVHVSLIYGFSVFVLYSLDFTIFYSWRYFIINTVLSILILFPLLFIHLQHISLNEQLKLVKNLSIIAYISFYLYISILSKTETHQFTFLLLAFECILLAVIAQVGLLIRDIDDHKVTRKRVFFQRIRIMPFTFVTCCFSFQKFVAYVIIHDMEGTRQEINALVLIFCTVVFSYIISHNKGSRKVNSLFTRSVILFYCCFTIFSSSLSLQSDVDNFLIGMDLRLDQLYFTSVVLVVMIFLYATGLEVVMLFGKHYGKDFMISRTDTIADRSEALYPTRGDK